MRGGLLVWGRNARSLRAYTQAASRRLVSMRMQRQSHRGAHRGGAMRAHGIYQQVRVWRPWCGGGDHVQCSAQ